MIERFNFYDVYGYLIPGGVTMLVVVLPLVLTGRIELPTGEWPLLIVGVLVAYLIGHLLQTMASTAIASSTNVAHERWKSPSALLVGSQDSSLTVEVKERLESLVRSWFGLEIAPSQVGDVALGNVRQDAFDLARRVVVKSANYAEQYEGLYAMMRGLTAALWIGAAYMAGWTLALWYTLTAYRAAGIVFTLSLIGFAVLSLGHFSRVKSLERVDVNRLSLALLGLGLLSLGYCSGVGWVNEDAALEFATIAVFYFAVGMRSLTSSQFFALEFAKAVWIDFASNPLQRPEK
ncbi:MAG TPA: hypothetical protein VHT92_05790 [Candidatus Cybelea sp.]|nr:hypothetical protein [Candidatus Cybelea sp.]